MEFPWTPDEEDVDQYIHTLLAELARTRQREAQLIAKLHHAQNFSSITPADYMPVARLPAGTAPSRPRPYSASKTARPWAKHSHTPPLERKPSAVDPPDARAFRGVATTAAPPAEPPPARSSPTPTSRSSPSSMQRSHSPSSPNTGAHTFHPIPDATHPDHAAGTAFQITFVDETEMRSPTPPSPVNRYRAVVSSPSRAVKTEPRSPTPPSHSHTPPSPRRRYRADSTLHPSLRAQGFNIGDKVCYHATDTTAAGFGIITGSTHKDVPFVKIQRTLHGRTDTILRHGHRIAKLPDSADSAANV